MTTINFTERFDSIDESIKSLDVKTEASTAELLVELEKIKIELAVVNANYMKLMRQMKFS